MPKKDEFDSLLRKAILKKVNTHKHVDEYQKRLLDSSDYPVLDGLEQSWQVLNSYYGNYDNNSPVINRHELRKEAGTPLGCFLNLLESGFYPPPEILLALADGFRTYFTAEGHLELEEIFFGKPLRGSGNFSKRKMTGRRYIEFHLHSSLDYMKAKRNGKKPPTLEKSAENWINDEVFGLQNEVDVDSFLRGYRRWRKNNRRTLMPY
jgi:hypothetical protein